MRKIQWYVYAIFWGFFSPRRRDSFERSLLHYYAFLGLWPFIHLYSHILDINAKDSDGRCPLHYAARWGHLKSVQVLIKKGADINCPSKTGNSALHEAIRDDETEIAQYLTKQGADVRMQNRWGKTPLQMAADDKNFKLYRNL